MIDARAGAERKETAIERAIGQVLKRQIPAMENARRRFMASGFEIMRYGFSPEYKFEYQTLNPKAWFMAKYGKTAEAMQVIVPSLVQATPYRLLTPYEWVSPQAKTRAFWTQNYLNYISGVNNHARSSRRTTEEAVGYGRGVRWTGRDPQSGQISSEWDTVRNLLVDANAKTWQDVHIIARVREWPRYQAIDLYPEARQTIMNLDVAGVRPSDTYTVYPWENRDTSTDVIRCYEFYLDIGIHNLKGGQEILKEQAKAQGRPASDQQIGMDAYGADETPLKYVIAESGRLLHVGPWDIPFHKLPCDRWPVTALDFYNNPDSIWPVSPLEPGIGFQRAMNHVITLLMGKYRYTSKTVLALKKRTRNALSPKDKDKAMPRLSNQDVEAIEVEMSGGDNMSIKNFIEQFDYSQEFIGYGLQLLEALERRYERLTGLTEFMSTGITDTQDRSARAAEIKDRNSRNRIEDMRDREAEHEALLARKEAFAARWLMQREDIGRVLGPQAAQAWGYLARPETMSVGYWAPQFMQMGADPALAQQMAEQKVADAVDIDQFALECDYSIESASVRRKDVDQQLDLFKELNNQVTSVQLASPDPNEKAVAYLTIATNFKLAGLPEELINALRSLAGHFQQLAIAPPPMPVAGDANAAPAGALA